VTYEQLGYGESMEACSIFSVWAEDSMKRPPSTLVDETVRAQILKIAAGLMEYRSQIAALAAGLPACNPTGDLSELRADLECALVDAFDPLLRALLAAGGKTSSSR
jgi:hypothetical protein